VRRRPARWRRVLAAGGRVVSAVAPVATVAVTLAAWRRLRRARKPAEPPVEAAAAPGAAEGTPPSPARRRFLGRVTLAAGGIVGAILAIPALGFFFAPAPRERLRVWRPVGEVGRFPIGATVQVNYLDPAPLPWAGFAAESAAWLRREGDQEFVAFTIYCTHTGCPVRWEERANLFLCPCHGGVFYRDGTVAAGPPPTPLVRYPVRVRDGVVEVETTPIPGRG
jgi:menaquinol-cytochrome c reductase iron-sulfur subunit